MHQIIICVDVSFDIVDPHLRGVSELKAWERVSQTKALMT